MLSLSSPDFLLSGDGPSSHPHTLLNHFGVISDYVLSLPSYHTSHQQILSTLLSKHVATWPSSSHLLHYHSSPSSHLANMRFLYSLSYAPTIYSLWSDWNRNKILLFFQILQQCLVGFRIKFSIHVVACQILCNLAPSYHTRLSLDLCFVQSLWPPCSPTSIQAHANLSSAALAIEHVTSELHASSSCLSGVAFSEGPTRSPYLKSKCPLTTLHPFNLL